MLFAWYMWSSIFTLLPFGGKCHLFALCWLLVCSCFLFLLNICIFLSICILFYWVVSYEYLGALYILYILIFSSICYKYFFPFCHLTFNFLVPFVVLMFKVFRRQIKYVNIFIMPFGFECCSRSVSPIQDYILLCFILIIENFVFILPFYCS